LPANRIELISAESGMMNFVRQVRRISRSSRFDLVHSHGFSAGALTTIALFGKRSLPHLMTAHDVLREAQFSGWRGRSRQVAMEQLFRRIDLIHAVTSDARNNFLEFFPSVNPDRAIPILHGVDTVFFRDGVPRNLKQELSLDPATPLIGFFGRFMGQKAFRVLVDAMENLVADPSLPMTPHVATFGWGGFIREDYEYLNSKNLGSYFHQLPQTHDMPGALKGVDVIAMPSRWEACGLLAMEALAAGLPIVGTNCIGLREVLEGSPAQMVNVDDRQGLAEALNYELEHLPSRKQEFDQYSSIADQRFGIERPARELFALYQTLTGKKD
ncbi:MAG: glycosyltransferase family 4 protein, partial [Thiohalomonadales bacterium]|nr:glycosyltransferase family 4 protein [Thiohalomonadales bacterium]